MVCAYTASIETGRCSAIRHAVLLAVAVISLMGTLVQKPACADSPACQTVKSRSTQLTVERHSVLGTRPWQGLNGKKLEPNSFGKLSALKRVWIRFSNRGDYYRKAEGEAAGQFCDLVQGKSKQYVESIAGRPRYRGGRISCWPSSKPGEDIWLYVFGETRVKAKVIFRDGLCSEATLYDGGDEIKYQEWRAKQICDFAIGKSVKQILAHEGLPESYNNHDSTASISLTNRQPHTIHYETGSNTAASLTIENQKCTKAYAAMIFH